MRSSNCATVYCRHWHRPLPTLVVSSASSRPSFVASLAPVCNAYIEPWTRRVLYKLSMGTMPRTCTQTYGAALSAPRHPLWSKGRHAEASAVHPRGSDNSALRLRFRCPLHLSQQRGFEDLDENSGHLCENARALDESDPAPRNVVAVCGNISKSGPGLRRGNE